MSFELRDGKVSRIGVHNYEAQYLHGDHGGC